MKQITLICTLICTLNASAQFNIKAGIVTPIPFYIQTNYTVDVSSALITSSYSIDKWDIKASTGYLRFRPNTPAFGLVQNIPFLIGGSYHVSPSFYVGLQAGPSYFAESKQETIKWLYSPHIGYYKNRFSIDLNYLNWEEVHDELNSLVFVVSYSLKKCNK